MLVAVGYLHGRTAPILDQAVPVAEASARIIDPVPQALVLTAILRVLDLQLVVGLDDDVGKTPLGRPVGERRAQAVIQASRVAPGQYQCAHDFVRRATVFPS